MVISTINQTIRQLGDKKYVQLGVLSHLWQAEHIAHLLPQAKRVLTGGIGVNDNQRQFKRQFAMPGELWTYAVMFDPNNLMAEMDYQQKARVAHHVWE